MYLTKYISIVLLYEYIMPAITIAFETFITSRTESCRYFIQGQGKLLVTLLIDLQYVTLILKLTLTSQILINRHRIKFSHTCVVYLLYRIKSKVEIKKKCNIMNKVINNLRKQASNKWSNHFINVNSHGLCKYDVQSLG